MTYSIGDVVYLNSGGPYMTVTYVDALDNELRCKWFFNGQENGFDPIDPDTFSRLGL
ncbi:YodC family protein [Aeromonas veronii]